MKPWVKVAVIAVLVLVVVQIIKRFSTGGDRDDFLPYLATEYETVAPSEPFRVTDVPLVVNAALTEVPVLTQVSGDLPSAVPVMVPTMVNVGVGASPGPSAAPTTVPIAPTPLPTLMAV